MDDGGAGRTNTLGFLSEYLAGGRSLIGKQVLIKFFADATNCIACGKCCMVSVAWIKCKQREFMICHLRKFCLLENNQ